MNSPALVVAILAAVYVPLAVLARFTRSYPTPRAALGLLAPAALAVGLPLAPGLRGPIIGLDVLLLAVLWADLMTLPRRRVFAVERETLRIASLRRAHPVTLTVANLSPQAYHITVRDGLPDALTGDPDPFAITLAPRTRATLAYALRASRRGAFTLEEIYLRTTSRLRLWQRHFTYPAQNVLHVYPDMRQLSEYALLARTNRLSLLGVRRARRIGQDHEFERLRDYTVDDNYKHIDWRSTARRRKLTVRDFQSSQSQRIVFLLDCGRMMTNEAAGLSLLDHALNAMLMLSYVALRQGDRVGLLCFSDEIHGFVPQRGGMQQMNRLLHAGFDRFPRLVESRYDLAFRYLATHCRRRALVVLVTNVIDEVNAQQVQRYLGNLSGKHLPLGVLLRDRQLFSAAEEGADVWRAAAAADILLWRQQVLADLRSSGALALDLFPECMTAPLVNQYLQVKARHLL